MERKTFQDPLTDTMIRCIVTVHRKLGPGFLEVIYRRALLIELRKASPRTETEEEFRVFYHGQ